jgi:hypothetical protein
LVNIKERYMSHSEEDIDMNCKMVNWVVLAQKRVWWGTLVMAEMNHQVLKRGPAEYSSCRLIKKKL